MLWDHLRKDTDELQFNPRLDLSNWGITTQLQNRWKKRPDKAEGGREGKCQNVYTDIKHESTGLAELRTTSRSSPFIAS